MRQCAVALALHGCAARLSLQLSAMNAGGFGASVLREMQHTDETAFPDDGDEFNCRVSVLHGIDPGHSTGVYISKSARQRPARHPPWLFA